jgi:hypothetical protein
MNRYSPTKTNMSWPVDDPTDSKYEYTCALQANSRIISEFIGTGAEKSVMTKLFTFAVDGTICNKKAIVRIAKSGKSDKEIINAILKLRKSVRKPTQHVTIANEYKRRSDRQKYLYKIIFDTHREILQHDAGIVPAYLDVGSDKGILTKVVADLLSEMLNRPCNAVGTDINSWDESKGLSERDAEYKAMGLLFAPIDYTSTTPFPVDGVFQLATLSHMMHHAHKHIPAIMKELGRLKVKYIIIREHDCSNKLFGGLIDIEHLVYATLNDGLSYDDSIPMCYGVYRTIGGWDHILADAGYNCIDAEFPVIKSDTRSYFRTYKRRE